MSIGRYVLRRVLLSIPTVLGVSVIVFLMIHMLPGDPAQLLAPPEATMEEVEIIRRRLGLDKPLWEQYLIFMSRALKGEFGESLFTGHKVNELLWPAYFNTLTLSLLAMAFGVTVGILLGIYAALKPNTLRDQAVTSLSLMGLSMPVFWLGLILIEVFSVWLRLFPSGGSGSPRHLVLPSLTLGLIGAAYVGRATRASMLEVLSEDYIRTARAYGLPNRKVIYVYALRNALIPVITVAGLIFGYMMAGAVLTETVFSYPGLGRLIVNAIFARDYPVVQAGILVVSITFVAINTAVDILYALINPRIRLE